jgi:hypothetical protein
MSTIDLTEVGTDGTMPVKSESLDNNVLCVDALTISQQDAIENATRVIQKYGGVNLFGKVSKGQQIDGCVDYNAQNGGRCF